MNLKLRGKVVFNVYPLQSVSSFINFIMLSFLLLRYLLCVCVIDSPVKASGKSQTFSCVYKGASPVSVKVLKLLSRSSREYAIVGLVVEFSKERFDASFSPA